MPIPTTPKSPSIDTASMEGLHNTHALDFFIVAYYPSFGTNILEYSSLKEEAASHPLSKGKDPVSILYKNILCKELNNKGTLRTILEQRCTAYQTKRRNV